MTIVSALRASLKAVAVRPEDKAAVALAEKYAALLDGQESDITKVGPAFLATLTALGLTPAGRAAVLGKGGGTGDGASRSKADELRERRAARQHAS
jgi:hypothetical protein